MELDTLEIRPNSLVVLYVGEEPARNLRGLRNELQQLLDSYGLENVRGIVLMGAPPSTRLLRLKDVEGAQVIMDRLMEMGREIREAAEDDG